MTLKVRRILSLVFILTFIVITPTVILYTAGYKLSKNGLIIKRTGMFIIDSQPKGAKIFIDGKPQQTFWSVLLNQKNYLTTPAKIKNLLPDDYEVKLELNGYFDWQKKLTVNPGASTFAEDVYLFKNNVPVQLATGEITNISLSPNKTNSLIISDGQLIFYNLADESSESVKQNGLKDKSVAWSSDGQRMIIGNFLYDLNRPDSPIDLSKITAGSFNFKWQENILSYRDKTWLYRLNVGNQSEKIGLSPSGDYLIKNGYLYLLNKTRLSATVAVINLNDGQQIKTISLPNPANYSFINPEQALLNVYDKNHDILYLFDPGAAYFPLLDTISGVKTTFWLGGNILLYANDFEIWLYNLSDKQKTLITRISQPISEVILHPSKNYVIYSAKQTINVIELDEREKRNTTELIKFDSIGAITLNPKGDTLYFSGRAGNQQGLYKLLMQ